MADFKVTADAVKVLMEHKRQLSRGLMTAILGKSFQYIPVNTGQMLRSTKMIADGEDSYALITPQPYAKEQYEKSLHHLKEGGAYKSISKTAVVALSAQDTALMRTMKGSQKFSYVYSTKLRMLKDAGKLTRETAQWFHRAYDDVMREGIEPVNQKAISAARALARQGAYYQQEVVK